MTNIKCTIFNTKETTNALGQVVTQFGILRQSSSDLVKNFKNADGVFSKVGSIFKTNDANAFASFIKQVDGGTRKLEAYKNTMTGCSKETRQLASQVVMGTISTKEATQGIKAMTGSTIGLTVATTALNMALTMGISMVLTGIISLISDAVHHFDNVKEKANGYIESLRSSNKEMSDNTKTISELNDEYKVLSKGVNSLGENVNLTSDEYKRYKEITNQVADIMPELVKGFNSQGDAILDTTAKLKDLNELYKITQRNKATEEYFKAKDNGEIDALNELWNTYHSDSDAINTGAISDFKEKYKVQYKSYLEELSTMDYKSLKSIVDIISTGYDAKTDEEKKNLVYRSMLNDLGFNSKSIEDDYNTIISNIQSKITSINTELQAINSQIGEEILHYAKTYTDYWDLDSELQTLVNSFFSNLDDETIGNLGLTNVNEQEKFVNEFIDNISKNSNEVQAAYKKLLTIDDESLSIPEKEKAIDNLIKPLSNYLKLPENQLKIILGLETEEDAELKKQYDTVTKQVAKRFGELKQASEEKTVGRALSGGQRTTIKTDEIYSLPDEIKQWQEKNLFTQEDVDLYQKLLRETKDENITFLELTQKFTEAKAEVIKANSQTLSELWGSINESDTKDPLAATKKSITELAKAGKLTSDTFKEISGSSSFLEKLGIKDGDAVKIDHLVQSLNDMHDSADQLSSMSKGISALSSNLATVKENEKAKKQSDRKAITSDTFTGMDSGLKEQTAEWENYKKVLGDVNSTYAECKQATNDLATAYVNSANFLANLTKENKGYYISQLDAMGVENAEEIVKQRLVDKTAQLSIENQMLAITKEGVTEKTIDEINSLYNEANASNTVKTALFELVAQQNIFNNTELSVADKITSLQNLATAAFGAAAGIELATQLEHSGNSTLTQEQIVANFMHRHSKPITIEPVEIKPTSSSSSGSGSKGKKGSGSGSKSNKEAQKKEIDWIEVRLDRLSDKYDKLSSKAEDGTAKLTNRTKSYTNAIKILNKEINTISKGIARYTKEANKYKKGLSKDIISKIEDGSIDIKNYKGDKLVKNIEGYQKYYDKVQDLIKKRNDINKQITSQKTAKIQLKIDRLDSRKDLEQAKITSLEKKIELNGGVGSKADYNKIEKYYSTQISYTKTQNDFLRQQQSLVKKGSEEWYKYQKAIKDNNNSIKELTSSMAENAVKGIDNITNKLNKHLENVDKEDEVINAKIKNATTANEKSALVDNRISNIDKRKQDYNSAIEKYRTEKKDAVSKIKGYKGSLKSARKQALSYIKQNKKIPDSLLKKVAPFDQNLYTYFVQYNEAIESSNETIKNKDLYDITSVQDRYDAGQEKYGYYQEEYQKNLNANSSAYDMLGKKQSYNETRGISKSVNDYNDLIKSRQVRKDMLVEERDGLKQLNEQLRAADEISQAQYEENLSTIKQLDDEIIECDTDIVQFGKDANNLKFERIEKLLDLLKNLDDRLDKKNKLAELHGNTDLVNERSAKQIKTEISSIEVERGKIKEAWNDMGKEFSKLGIKWDSGTQSLLEYYLNNDPKKFESFFDQWGYSYENLTGVQELVDIITTSKNNVLDSVISAEEKVDTLYDSHIQKANKWLEAVEKEKDIKDRTLAIEKARFNLEKAKNNLTVKTWDATMGQWVYTADEEAVRSAQETYDNTVFDNLTNTIKDLIDVLEEQKINFNLFDDNGNLIDPNINLNDLMSAIQQSTDKIMTPISDALTSYMSGWYSTLPQPQDYVNATANSVLSYVQGFVNNNTQSNQTSQTTTFTFDKLVLPNVKNTDDFIRDLELTAKQYDWSKR